MTDTQIELASGRKIGVSGYGDPASEHIVIFCNPTPGAGAFNPDPLITDTFDTHVVVVDRPGYGGSDQWDDQSFPTVEAAAGDLRDYLELSGIAEKLATTGAKLGVVGWGWGGATALCFASRNAALVGGVAVVGTMRPARARGGERGSEVCELRRPRYISSVAGAVDSLRPGETSTLGALGVRPDDRDLTALGALNRVENLIADASGTDLAGVAFDRLTARDTAWSAALGEITTSCLLVYGDHDSVAGPADAAWYRRRLPEAHVVTMAGSGRLAIIPSWRVVLQHVVPR